MSAVASAGARWRDALDPWSGLARVLRDPRAAARQSARDLLYLSLTLLTAATAMAIFIAGVSITASLAIFIIAIPVLLVTVEVFRWTAELDRQLAAIELGAPLRGRYRRSAVGIWARVAEAVRDPQRWRDAGWLAVTSVLGFAFGTAALALVGSIAMAITAPVWYWTVDDDVQIFFWHANSLPMAILTSAIGILLLPLASIVLRMMAAAQLRLAVILLETPQSGHAPIGGATASPGDPVTGAAGGAYAGSGPAIASTEERPRPRLYNAEVAMTMHAGLALLAGGLCTMIWGLTGLGYFWPVWVWFGLAVSVALHLVILRAARLRDGRRLDIELSLLAAAICVVIWALSGFGTWLIWPLLGLAVKSAAIVIISEARSGSRSQLSRRVDTLTRTRRDAADAQAAELRRIERDLHDGAQARLVALSMQLGRAEARLAESNPQEAELLRQARGEAGAAIKELRDLARGIAPPVLADRGLVAAVEALATRSPMTVNVYPRVERPLPPAVETCAYFVCAESIANVAKHAPEAAVSVTLHLEGDTLTIDVADDGPGGADEQGGGLVGLRRRVAALDGEFHVRSRPEAGTEISAVLPCGS